MGSDTFTLGISFVVNFLATLGGVFIAFRLTVWYDKRKKAADEKEIKKRIVSALSVEIEKNFDDVKANMSQLGPGNFVVAIFRTSAHESAMNSGNLLLLKEDLRNSLANIYLNFQFVETIAAKTFSMLGTASAFQNWGQYSKRVDQMLMDRLTILERDIPGTLDLLKRETEILSEVKKVSETSPSYLAGLPKKLKNPAKYLVLGVGYVILVWLSQLLTANSDWLGVIGFLGSIGLGVGIVIAVKRKSWVKHYTTSLTWLAISLGSITAGQLSRTTIFLAQFVQYDLAVIVGLGMFVILIAVIFYLLDIFRSGGLIIDLSDKKS